MKVKLEPNFNNTLKTAVKIPVAITIPIVEYLNDFDLIKLLIFLLNSFLSKINLILLNKSILNNIYSIIKGNINPTVYRVKNPITKRGKAIVKYLGSLSTANTEKYIIQMEIAIAGISKEPLAAHKIFNEKLMNKKAAKRLMSLLRCSLQSKYNPIEAIGKNNPVTVNIATWLIKPVLKIKEVKKQIIGDKYIVDLVPIE
ncbi:MAG: hypothetical protein FWH29_07340 [Methanobrevibacter sp.]|nr:hypothetical protein [Methanobrevibacter sp.]